MHSGIDPKTLQLKDIVSVSIKVTYEDFLKEHSETIPRFGIERDLYKLFPRGIALFSNEFKDTKRIIKDCIDSLLSTEASLMCFCISGVKGSGIRSFTVSTAKEGFLFVKLIHPKDFFGKSEDQICSNILEVFLDAYKSKMAAIIIDDIDAIVQFSPIGPRFSSRILGTLLTLMKQAPVTSKLPMNYKNSTKKLEFSPILSIEKSCPENFTFDIKKTYVYQSGYQDHEFVPIIPLNWKVWFVPVYITSFIILKYFAFGIVNPKNDYHTYMIMIASAIASLIITIIITVVDITKYEQPTRNFSRDQIALFSI